MGIVPNPESHHGAVTSIERLPHGLHNRAWGYSMTSMRVHALPFSALFTVWPAQAGKSVFPNFCHFDNEIHGWLSSRLLWLQAWRFFLNADTLL